MPAIMSHGAISVHINRIFGFPKGARIRILSYMALHRRTLTRGAKQLRKGRFSGRNQIYHVSSATHERRPVFATLASGRILVKAMMHLDQVGCTETLAFVVMPDHFHWLLQLTGDRTLSDCVCIAKSGSARNINTITGERRQIWQSGFHDRAIRKEEDLASVARYIIANPLRAGIADSVSRYSLWDAKWL